MERAYSEAFGSCRVPVGFENLPSVWGDSPGTEKAPLIGSSSPKSASINTKIPTYEKRLQDIQNVTDKSHIKSASKISQLPRLESDGTTLADEGS